MTTQKESEYIIGEARHLLYCGMDPVDVCKTLNRSASSLANMFARRNENTYANIFYRIKTTNKG